MSLDPKFIIRPAEIEDAPSLALIGATTFVDSYCSVLPGKNIIAHCATEHSVSQYQSFFEQPVSGAWLAMLQKNAAAIGYAVNLAPDLPMVIENGDIELKRIYVLSQYHGRGVGKALLASAINHARQQGAGRLLLGVYDQNKRALEFYRRQGFIKLGTRKFQVGCGFCNDLVLGLPLTGTRE